MIRGRDINTVLNFCQSALDMQTDRMVSKHLCNYKSSLYKLSHHVDHFDIFRITN